MEIPSDLQVKLNPGVRVGWRRTLFSHEKHQESLTRDLVNLVEEDEAFSLIVMGPRWSGKNTFVETCIFNAKEKSEAFRSRNRVIRLNGMVCGKSVRASVTEIFAALKLSDNFQEKDVKNFDDRLDIITTKLRECLSEEESKRIFVFVLDYLEYFCDGVQFLLYNLFDLIANGKGLLGVICITSRIDVTELFEKRVKSRFSHKIINLTNCNTFEEYQNMAVKLLRLDEPEHPSWNKGIVDLMKKKEVTQGLERLYETDRSIGQLTLFLYELVVVSHTQNDIAEGFKKMWEKYNMDTRVQLCLDLSLYDLMLLVAIKINFHRTVFTFDNLWEAVNKLAAQYSADRSDLKSSLISLEALDLVVVVKIRGRTKRKTDAALYSSILTMDQLDEVFSSYPFLSTAFADLIMNKPT